MRQRVDRLDGVSAIRLLAEKGVSARVLVLTTFDTDTDVVPAIEAGATCYLLKDSPPVKIDIVCSYPRQMGGNYTR
jgi:DNA-binding NarL/FixJ family response regulator